MLCSRICSLDGAPWRQLSSIPLRISDRGALGWSHLKAQSLKYLALLLRKLKQLGAGRAAAPQAFCELSPHSCPAEMLHGVKLLYCLKLPKICPKRKKPAQNSKCILLVNAVAKYCPVPEGGGRKYILSLDMGGRQDSERACKIGNTIVGFLKKSSTKLITLYLSNFDQDFLMAKAVSFTISS